MLGIHQIGQLTVGPIKGPAPAVLIQPQTTVPQGGGGTAPDDSTWTLAPPADSGCKESFIRNADCSLKPVPIVGGLVALGIAAGLLLRQG